MKQTGRESVAIRAKSRVKTEGSQKRESIHLFNLQSSVVSGNFSFFISEIVYGIPQGSVLVPLRFPIDNIQLYCLVSLSWQPIVCTYETFQRQILYPFSIPVFDN